MGIFYTTILDFKTWKKEKYNFSCFLSKIITKEKNGIMKEIKKKFFKHILIKMLI